MTMKAFVINLSKNVVKFDKFKKRFDAFFKDQDISLERFDAFNGQLITYDKLRRMGYDTLSNWREPSINRKQTHGEIGCSLSHLHCWLKCIELNEPILIFEDDVEFYSTFNLERVKQVLSEHEFVYLSRKKLTIDQEEQIADDLVVPSYSYWNCAYGITPAAAKKLCNKLYYKNLIINDEYIPVVLGNSTVKLANDFYKEIPKINGVAFTPNICNPIDGAFAESDTEIAGVASCYTGQGSSYFVDFDTYVYTVATDLDKAKQLTSSAKHNRIKLKVLGAKEEWKGGDIKNNPGGGMKINLLKKELYKHKDDDVILFVDGYDVLLNDTLDSIVQTYLSFHSRVVFAAEKNCWPDSSMKDSFVGTEHGNNYLNSGCYIGVVSELKKILAEEIQDSEDDQLYFQKQYLSCQFDMTLDTHTRLFQCVAQDEDNFKINEDLKIQNIETGNMPKILHGNGGEYSKEKFDHSYYILFQPLVNEVHRFVCDGTIKTIGPDILLMKFMTKEMCVDMIKLAELTAKKGDGFRPLPGDAYPAQEIRIREMDRNLYYAIEDNLEKYVYPALERYYKPLKMFGIKDLFIIKYNKKTQKSLALHNDISLVSGSVKLNDSYTGAELYFPRQQMYNRDIEIGDLLLWPSQVTHPHESLPIYEGTKYSLVLWTKRFKGD
jgi:GR25 family glycosyltransferase involved in LPS biosynthesis